MAPATASPKRGEREREEPGARGGIAAGLAAASGAALGSSSAPLQHHILKTPVCRPETSDPRSSSNATTAGRSAVLYVQILQFARKAGRQALD